MVLPKLFIKNDKGRYEPFNIDNDVSDTVFMRRNGKYVPIGRRREENSLTEGIWIVYGTPSCRSILNGTYAHELFNRYKVADLPDITLIECASLSKLTDEICHALHQQADCHLLNFTVHDFVAAVVGELYRQTKDKNGEDNQEV